MREDVIGRSRVQDTEELERYYAELGKFDAGALWTVANEIEPWYPQPRSVPMHWRYQDLRPLVLKSASLVSGDDAGRRVVMLVNEGRRELSAAVGLLYTGLQIMNPGEAMTAHRHAAAALRFVIEGEGAWTIVDGDRLKVGPRDFAITPKGTWHEHGNDSAENPVIWQDGLDIPLINALDANFYEVHPELHQVPGAVVNTSLLRHGAGVLKPDRRSWSKRYSPLLAYPWDMTYQALLDQAKVSEGTPYDGVIMEYVNPVTGGSVMPTMGAHMQLLRPGQATQAHRHTGSVIYHVAKGRGHSIVAGRRFDWKENDIFAVPSWAWHEHANDDDADDACLFSFNDFPMIHSLDLWAEEAYSADGGHQPVL
ncbi:gentisate 1,2-dioxygenase [Sphaerisporangium siamense]|uniref:Gentisate 1,2-dioxygenase n=1 Tax=Sphaerisporangium siamense TaxID=795645 RepID=A0A7W7DBB5_9ACTN|nr:cupin domain-containing protein [Sphaerisporangium siamense]MBB4703471.1 gentisate 1,2-dioxygenase [Sphaerisporangium siamense]GII87535.1 gentisate 1,2-dioxygenase [Sphaerisporangium siamense]